MTQPLVLCRHWPEEDGAMMDLVSGTEVPTAIVTIEPAPTPAMLNAGQQSCSAALSLTWRELITIYRAMRRAELEGNCDA